MYGADRRIIIKAANSDRSCVLACALAAGYLLTQQEVNAHVYLTAAKHNVVCMKLMHCSFLGFLVFCTTAQSSLICAVLGSQFYTRICPFDSGKMKEGIIV
jgi:hypothetical protein